MIKVEKKEKPPTDNPPLFVGRIGEIYLTAQISSGRYQLFNFVDYSTHHMNRFEDDGFGNIQEVTDWAIKNGLKPFYGEVVVTIKS